MWKNYLSFPVQVKAGRCSLFTLLLLFYLHPLVAQDISIPKVIPPSPNAISSLAAIDNKNNFYTGKLSVTIPIWEIPSKSFRLPVSLNYTGGNGIKLEEVSSWVGLGWGLTADYSVSRVANGFQDDKFRGYLEMDTIPAVNQTNAALYQEYAQGIRDSEPDIFNYTLPDGESGSFVFGLDDSVKLKTKRNVKISYTRDANDLINGFTIVSENGNVCYFTAMEKTRSVVINADPPPSDLNYYATSWYLTKVVDHDHTDSVVYEYEQDEYYIWNESPSTQRASSQGLLNPTLTESRYQTKRISKIIFTNGVVEFLESSGTRKDVACCAPYLDKIRIKKNNDSVVRTIAFKYSYFGSDRNYGIDESMSPSPSGSLRLKLDSILVYPARDTAGQALVTRFMYFENRRLPDRASKSRDHWGYFNGKANTSLEPKRLEKVKFLSVPWEIVEYGTADRSAVPEYAQSYILKKVEYPTGGISEFEFEGNRAKSEGLDVKDTLSSYVNNLIAGENLDTIQVLRITSPALWMNVNGSFPDADETISSSQLVFRLKFTKTDNSKIYYADFYEISNFQHASHHQSFLIDSGTYYVQLLENYNPNNSPAIISFNWINELPCNNCLVGGLRVKSISNITATDTLRKIYRYEESAGVSSGSLASLPEYGSHLIQDDGTFVSYSSYFNSNYPLITTQGNVVGYEKITESADELFTNGKTEYTFTTARDHPDSDRGDFFTPCDDYYTVDGKKYHKYPVPTPDSREFLRGLLLKQVDYKKTDAGQFVKVKQLENDYELIKYNPCKPDFNSFDYVIEYTKQTSAFKGSWGDQGYHIRFYDIHGGYAMLKETRQKIYENDSLVTVTKYDYRRNSDGLIEHFVVNKSEFTNSKGKIRKTITEYPYDMTVNNADPSGIYQAMLGRNVLNPVVQQKVFMDNSILSTARVNYSFWQGNTFIRPASTQSGIFNNPLETKLVVQQYDDAGNITTQQKADDIRFAYVWGYNKMYLVAEVTNANASDVYYTSFEETDGNSAVGDSRTGNFSRTGGYNKSLAGLTNGSYKLSWWVKNGNSWSFQSSVVEVTAGAYIISLSGQIDEVRFHPAKAQMTTYTYDPLVGMTSQCDIANKISYFEYDAFGRLKLTRDQDKNILKTFDYKYQANTNQ